MAHAAYNERRIRTGVRVMTRNNGSPPQTTVQNMTFITDRCSATTKNRKQAGGYRAMANYSRGGGVRLGVTGLLVNIASPTQQTWEGVLCPPGGTVGTIGEVESTGGIQAIRSALGSFGDREVKLGVALQEAKDTARMVGKYYNHANQLTDKLVKSVQGDRRTRQQFRDFARNGWKGAPGAYLEYLFGMAPIADDLQNAAFLLAERKDAKSAMILVLRGRFSASDSFQSAGFNSPNTGPLVAVRQDVTVSQRTSATMRFKLPDWYWETLPPVTPFRQAWETTRLSFVIDWVLPISSWLSGFEGFQLRPFFMDGCTSTLLARNISGAHWSQNGYLFVPRASGGRDWSFSRQVFTSFPSEQLFSLPKMKNELGLNQLRVGSALLAQKLAGLQRAIRL